MPIGWLLGILQDHKAVGEGDVGPNTGGMGAYSPAPALTPLVEQQVLESIVQRTADAMCAEGHPFQGILFAGLMIKDGQVTMVPLPSERQSTLSGQTLLTSRIHLAPVSCNQDVPHPPQICCAKRPHSLGL